MKNLGARRGLVCGSVWRVRIGGHLRIVRPFADAERAGRNVYEIMYDPRVNGARWAMRSIEREDVQTYVPAARRRFESEPLFRSKPEYEHNRVNHNAFSQPARDGKQCIRGHRSRDGPAKGCLRSIAATTRGTRA